MKNRERIEQKKRASYSCLSPTSIIFIIFLVASGILSKWHPKNIMDKSIPITVFAYGSKYIGILITVYAISRLILGIVPASFYDRFHLDRLKKLRYDNGYAATPIDAVPEGQEQMFQNLERQSKQADRLCRKNFLQYYLLMTTIGIFLFTFSHLSFLLI